MKYFLFTSFLLFLSKISSSQQPWKTGCVDGFRLLFIKEKKTYEQARASCKGLGGILAKVDNQRITETINSKFVIDGQENTFYIGGNDIIEEGEWTWQDGSDVVLREEDGYQNWKFNQPNGGTSENCMVVGRETYQWTDISCSEKFNYICQTGPFVEIQHISDNQKRCVATECTNATLVKWFKQSEIVTDKNSSNTYQTLQSGSATLTLNHINATIADTGTYTCLAWIDDSWKGGVSIVHEVDGDPTIYNIENNTCNPDLVVTWQPHKHATGLLHLVQAWPLISRFFANTVEVWVHLPASGKQSTTIRELTPHQEYRIKIVACKEKRLCGPFYTTSLYTTEKLTWTGGEVIAINTSSITQHKENQTCVISWSISEQDGIDFSYVAEINMTSTVASSRYSYGIVTRVEVKNISTSAYTFQPEPNRNYSVTSLKLINCAGSSIPATPTGTCIGKPRAPDRVESPTFDQNDQIRMCGIKDMTIRPPDESNGLVSCLFVIVDKNRRIYDGEETGIVGEEFNMDSLTKLNNSSDGGEYIAMAIPASSVKGEIKIRLGNLETTVCDVYDTGKAFAFKHRESLIVGHNKRLDNYDWNIYSVSVVSATPSSDKIYLKRSRVLRLQIPIERVNAEFDFSITSFVIGFAVGLLLALAVALPIICKQKNIISSYKKGFRKGNTNEANCETMEALHSHNPDVQPSYSPEDSDAYPHNQTHL